MRVPTSLLEIRNSSCTEDLNLFCTYIPVGKNLFKVKKIMLEQVQ